MRATCTRAARTNLPSHSRMTEGFTIRNDVTWTPSNTKIDSPIPSTRADAHDIDLRSDTLNRSIGLMQRSRTKDRHLLARDQHTNYQIRLLALGDAGAHETFSPGLKDSVRPCRKGSHVSHLVFNFPHFAFDNPIPMYYYCYSFLLYCQSKKVTFGPTAPHSHAPAALTLSRRSL